MAKQIIIYKCEECPHAQFDPQENPAHWSKWVCIEGACNIAEEGRVLDGRSVTHGPPPQWCNLDNDC